MNFYSKAGLQVGPFKYDLTDSGIIISTQFSGLKFVPIKWRYLVPPASRRTDRIYLYSISPQSGEKDDYHGQKQEKKTKTSILERSIPCTQGFSRKSDLIGCICQIPMTKAIKNNAILFYICWMVMHIFNRPAVLCNS